MSPPNTKKSGLRPLDNGDEVVLLEGQMIRRPVVEIADCPDRLWLFLGELYHQVGECWPVAGIVGPALFHRFINVFRATFGAGEDPPLTIDGVQDLKGYWPL